MAHPISLAVNQVGKKPTLLGWRLGRCALQWLQGQCTILIDVSQAGLSESLHLMRRCLKAMGVSWHSEGQLLPEEQSAVGAWESRGDMEKLGAAPAKGIRHSGEVGLRSSWEVSPLVRVRYSLLINRQVHGGKYQARTSVGRAGDQHPTVSLRITIFCRLWACINGYHLCCWNDSWREAARDCNVVCIQHWQGAIYLDTGWKL